MYILKRITIWYTDLGSFLLSLIELNNNWSLLFNGWLISVTNFTIHSPLLHEQPPLLSIVNIFLFSSSLCQIWRTCQEYNNNNNNITSSFSLSKKGFTSIYLSIYLFICRSILIHKHISLASKGALYLLLVVHLVCCQCVIQVK